MAAPLGLAPSIVWGGISETPYRHLEPMPFLGNTRFLTYGTPSDFRLNLSESEEEELMFLLRGLGNCSLAELIPCFVFSRSSDSSLRMVSGAAARGLHKRGCLESLPLHHCRHYRFAPHGFTLRDLDACFSSSGEEKGLK